MNDGGAQKLSNLLLSVTAGVSSFLFSLGMFLNITKLDQQVLAALLAGSFCLMVCYVAAERRDSHTVGALAALARRLLAVEKGDFASPAPGVVHRVLPKLAAAVEKLFAEVRASLDNAHALGMYDPVTSLPNRLHFRAEVDKLLAIRSADQLGAMLFIDLDRFKAVNDRLGHARGDQLLVMVANRLRVLVTAEFTESGGTRPLLARLAGDEFTLFLPEVRSPDDIDRVARRAVAAIAAPFEVAGQCVDIGASVGAAVCPDHGATVEALMRAADIAMYRAKAGGGFRHAMFCSELAAEHRNRVETEQALVAALERGEFLLALQPQLNLQTGEISGAEALLRWDHPRDGLRPPASFIPIAEQSGLIVEIGEWVIDEVAALLGSWAAEREAPRIAFNVSPRQLERADFFHRLRAALAAQGVPLSRIELELSESTAMECSQAVLEELALLRADGASVAIDDFGTGHSNIARLRSMPLDRIKLDPSLIADVTASDTAREVVQAVIQLARSVRAEVVAEAVETVGQADVLRSMGCDTVQGFIFAHPMFDADFRCWMRGATVEVRTAA